MGSLLIVHMQATQSNPPGASAPRSTFSTSTLVVDSVTEIVLHGTVLPQDLVRFFAHTAHFAEFTQAWVIDWSQTVVAIAPHHLINRTHLTRRPVAHILRIDQTPLFSQYLEACAARGLRREYFRDSETAHAWVKAARLDRCERVA